MKIILVLLLACFVYKQRESIAKIIAGIAIVCIALKLGGETLMAIVLTLGAWAAIFLFFYVVSGDWEDSHYEKHKYDDYFEARDRWDRRHRR
jgi:hypothetical protein